MNRRSSSWTAINSGPVVIEYLNSPDLNELDKKCRWMLPDLVDSYKQAAVEAANPSARRANEAVQGNVTGGISHRDILDKASGLVIAKFPSAAKSRTNPAPAPKIYPRFDSFSDIDNMALYADDLEPSELPKPKGVVKQKASGAETSDEPEPPKWVARQPNVRLQPEPRRRNGKRKADDEVAGLEDTPPPESAPDVHRIKKMPSNSDKENDLGSRHDEVMSQLVPWTTNVPTHKTRPSTAMNVSKKRSLQDIDVPILESNKRMKLDTEPAVAVSLLLEARLTPAARDIPTAADEAYRQEDLVNCKKSELPVEQTRHRSPSASFSDQDALFEQIISRENNSDTATKDESDHIGDVSLDSIPLSLLSATLLTSATTPSATLATVSSAPAMSTATVPAESSAISMSQADVEPSLRRKPSPLDDNHSVASYLGPDGRTITCFRIAEALRIRADAMNAPILLSDASKPSSTIEIELFARVNLTYRASSTQVFVFEDIWFPNRLPILRAVHKSWQQCEEEAPALLRENREQSSEGGFLCRAVLLLDTNRHTSSSGDFQGDVVRVRAAEWCEIEEVRSVVEPQYQIS